MKDKSKQKTDLRDKNEAAEKRPVPSQAEGDLETVEEGLERKEQPAREERIPSGKQDEWTH